MIGEEVSVGEALADQLVADRTLESLLLLAEVRTVLHPVYRIM